LGYRLEPSKKKKKKNKEQLINVAWDTEKNDLSSLM
jgi:hypothetical protein